MPTGLKYPFYGILLASGTQNLSPAACNKTQNKKTTGNGGGGNDFASHLLYSVIVIIVQILIQKGYH